MLCLGVCRTLGFALHENFSASISGAPNNSSGLVVPRPSDKRQPSINTVPGKHLAIFTLAALGLGFTHGTCSVGQP